MLPITKKLTSYNHTKGNNNIKYIVIHDTGNYMDSDEGNAKYFSEDGRKASAHYFVDDKDQAWHCGDGKGTFEAL